MTVADDDTGVGSSATSHRLPPLRVILLVALGVLALLWYTCIFGYLVASVIDDRPLVSTVAPVIVTTGLLALLDRPLKRHWEETAPTPAPSR